MSEMIWATKAENPVYSPSLYTLTGELEDAIANVTVDEETGEICGLDEMNAIAINTQEKTVAVARAIKNLDALEAQIKVHKQEIDRRLKVISKIKETLKYRSVNAMQVLGVKKLATADICLSTRRSESVDVYDESLLPKEFIVEKVTYAPNKIALKEALKRGEDIQGACIKEKLSLVIK